MCADAGADDEHADRARELRPQHIQNDRDRPSTEHQQFLHHQPDVTDHRDSEGVTIA
jgi:hypothetical protein